MLMNGSTKASVMLLVMTVSMMCVVVVVEVTEEARDGWAEETVSEELLVAAVLGIGEVGVKFMSMSMSISTGLVGNMGLVGLWFSTWEESGSLLLKCMIVYVSVYLC